MDSDDFKKFDGWVREGIGLLDEELGWHNYQFLYQLHGKLSVPERTYIKKILMEHLNRIDQKNLVKITRESAANMNSVIKELKNNILLENYCSIFYCIELLAERIADLIIKKEHEVLEPEISSIRARLRNSYFLLKHKIELLNILFEHYKTDDLKILIKILQLLNVMRNKFMFHINNYDDLGFVFESKISEKEDLLSENIIQPVRRLINEVLDLEILDDGVVGQRICTFYSQSLSKLEEYYEKQKSDEESLVLNIEIYNSLPRNFAEISYIFILFFGKENLNLFENNA